LRRTADGNDVFGKAPISKAGEYFRNNAFWWRPLADYACKIAPRITATCKHWQSNDGDGLGAAAARELADALQAEIDSGRCERYARIYASAQALMPDEPCWLCEGTGTRRPAPLGGAGDCATGVKCNACDGEGHIRPNATMYPFGLENVREFVVFLRACGGFEIW
jgi:hypothetical protein